MGDLFDYIDWRGDLTFEQTPFCKIDAMLFAQISYLKFDSLVQPDFNNQILLPELCSKFKSASDYGFRTNLGPGVNARTADLLEKAASSERFKNVKITGYQEKTDENTVEQFAAMTFVFDKTAVITFRGTDSTIVGWKEDCNIACLDEIPSHKDCVEYCLQAFVSLRCDFMITGHSKGGHLAIYSAVNSGHKFQKKLKAVFNFDGPGFSSAFYAKPEFIEIENRLVNIYPSGSLVGMIFHHPRDFEIVKSSSHSAGQHDPVSWQILGNSFVHKKEFSKESIFFYNSLNKWIETMSVEQKTGFVNSVFEVIEASDCKTITEIADNVVLAAAKMLKHLSGMDKETKAQIDSAVKALRQCVKNEIPILRIMNI